MRSSSRPLSATETLSRRCKNATGESRTKKTIGVSVPTEVGLPPFTCMKRMVGRPTSKAKARPRPADGALDRRRMITELRAAEEHIALSALDALSTHLAILDARGKILATNKAW